MTISRPQQSPAAENASANSLDQLLVEQAQQELPGCTGSFEQLLARHHCTLARVCRKLLNRHPDYEDVVQEVILNAMGSLTEFEGRSSFRTWLLSIARNTCYNYRLQSMRRFRLANAMRGELASDVTGAESGSLSDALDLGSALLELPPAERQLVSLRYLAGLSFEEVASATGLKLSATKMRIYRAVDKLRDGRRQVSQQRFDLTRLAPGSLTAALPGPAPAIR